MSTTRFNLERLQLELARLPEPHRMAFAASCCERMVPERAALSRNPSYETFAQLRSELDRIWSALSRADLPFRVLRPALRYWEDENADAEDLVCCRLSAVLCGSQAVLKSAHCLGDASPRRVAEVAGHVLAGISMFVRCREGTSPSKGEVDRTQDHPMFADEIQRQRRLLDTLAEGLRSAPPVERREWFCPPAGLLSIAESPTMATAH